MLPASIAQSVERTNLSELGLAGIGCFAQVFKVADTGFVIKQTFNHPVVGNLQQSEKRIYERLGPHSYILRYYGEYCGGGSLLGGLTWPVQAAEALRFIHSKNVIHSDFGSHNFLVQRDGNLALADFGGSRIDDDMAVMSYSTRYSRADCDPDVSTEADDTFALGTLLYEIIVGHPLYAVRQSKDIRKLLKLRKFPDLAIVPQNFRMVIHKC
ncbi:kinase-like domain-containing protein [Aspergillus venezuelensis]